MVTMVRLVAGGADLGVATFRLVALRGGVFTVADGGWSSIVTCFSVFSRLGSNTGPIRFLGSVSVVIAARERVTTRLGDKIFSGISSSSTS